MGKGIKLIILGIVIFVFGMIIAKIFMLGDGSTGFGDELGMVGIVILIVGIILVKKSKVNYRSEKVSHQREEEKQVSHQKEEEEDDPLDILKKRLAKGEITKEEFDNIKKDLA